MNNSTIDIAKPTLSNAVAPIFYFSLAAASAGNLGVSVYRENSLIPLEFENLEDQPNSSSGSSATVEVISPQSADLFSKIIISTKEPFTVISIFQYSCYHFINMSLGNFCLLIQTLSSAKLNIILTSIYK